ncbi:unnamed protein product, partial [Pylaiella littoralis]
GGGGGGGGGGDAEVVAPVSVSTRVDVYFGGSVRSLSLSGGAADSVTAAELLWGQEAQMAPPLDDAGGSSDSGHGRSGGRHVSFDQGGSNRNAAGGPLCFRKEKRITRSSRSSSRARYGSDGGSARRREGEVSRAEKGKEQRLHTTLNGCCSAASGSATATTAAAVAAAAAAESKAEEEKSAAAAAATAQASVGGTPCRADERYVVSSARVKAVATELSGAKTAAGDWYRHSKLSYSASGLQGQR